MRSESKIDTVNVPEGHGEVTEALELEGESAEELNHLIEPELID